VGELAGTQLTVFLLGLAVLLGSAHLLGEVARRFGQPVVIGEMLAGLALGPTCLGWLAPQTQQWLFPHSGPAAIGLDGVVILGVALLLLLAGMEVDLSSVWRQGKVAALVALGGIVVPMLAGVTLAWLAPRWWGMPEAGSPGLFALFFGSALAVSALPVIAKVLLDLDLFQTDFGVLVLVAATINNLAAWLAFSIVLGGSGGGHSILSTVLLTLAFAAGMLTLGRWLVDRCIVWGQAHLNWPAGVLGFAVVCGLLGAAATEAIGIHAIFGAFLAGIALGDSPHLRDHTRHIVHRFVEGTLAPIFVAAIGLKVNFIASFEPGLVLRVLAVGIAFKFAGAWLGARLAGCRPIEAQGLGWALNARGEMGIVLGVLAWQHGIITEPLFVAIVLLAVITSAMTGPLLIRLLKQVRTLTLGAMLDSRTCITDLHVGSVRSVIQRLSEIAAERSGLSATLVAEAVLAREEIMGTGIGHGVAVPHARLDGVTAPTIVVGVVSRGVNFDGIDDEPVRLVFLVLTPLADPVVQLQLLSAIGQLCHDPQLREEAMAARTPTELLGVLRVAGVLQKEKKG